MVENTFVGVVAIGVVENVLVVAGPVVEACNGVVGLVLDCGLPVEFEQLTVIRVASRVGIDGLSPFRVGSCTNMCTLSGLASGGRHNCLRTSAIMLQRLSRIKKCSM